MSVFERSEHNTNMSNEEFMQWVDLYERAMKVREDLDFARAITMFQQAAAAIPASVGEPLRIAFFYDMALAYDLGRRNAEARQLFQKAVDIYDRATGSDDPAIANFAGLVWGIKDFLSVSAGANPSDETYINHVTVRRWPPESMPLKLYIDRSNATGFDGILSNVVLEGFRSWTNSGGSLRLAETNDRGSASIIVTRVTDGLGTSGGHTGFEEMADANGVSQLRSATIRIALHTKNANELNERARRIFASLVKHEAGHALGLDGHSPHASDLMYWKSPLCDLSPRDKKTFRAVYP